MTNDELEAAIRAGEREECLRLVCEASEAERRAAAPRVMAWCRATAAARAGRPVPEDPPLPAGGDVHAIALTAGIAALGTLSAPQLQELEWRVVPWPGYLSRLVAARSPEWRAAWARRSLEEAVPPPDTWLTIRRLVREGELPLPDGENYILGMIGQPRAWKSLPDLLLGDPGLLAGEVWRLFEVEGGGEYSLASHDNYANTGAQWGPALVQLAADGRLPRARLLDASLDALARDFGQFRAGWFSRFHEALAPTPAERQERLDRYLGLLSSRIPPTVSLALNALSILDKSGTLPPDRLVEHAGAALAAREKATVTRALKLLTRALAVDASLSVAIARLAAGALAHEAPEVQAAALDLIERAGAAASREMRSCLIERLGGIAPSVRGRLELLVGEATSLVEPKAASLGEEHRELLARADAVPEPWATLAGIPPAREAFSRSLAAGVLDGGDEFPLALDLHDPRIPRLDPDSALQPIGSLEELIDAFTVVLEQEGPPEEIERVLEGVARLGSERPDGWDRLVGPLRKRLKALAPKAADPFSSHRPQGSLCAVGLAWLTGELRPARPEDSPSLPGFLARRTVEICRGIAGGKTTTLVSCPTHAPGWIDPVVLVRRSASGGEPAGLLDGILALLRLAPEHRSEALAQSTGIPGEWGSALRHALGADGEPIGPTPALWAAAARARRADGDDAEVERRHPAVGPDGARAARLRLESVRREWTAEGKTYTYFEPRLVREPPATTDPDLVPALVSDPPRWAGAAMLRWCASVWPAGRERWFGSGAQLLGGNLDWEEAEWGNRVFLEGLLSPDIPFDPMARLLLALGLGAKEPGESGLATDALIAAIDDGRIDAARLAGAFTALLTLGLGRPQRWAKTLADAARISPLHAETVRSALETVLAPGMVLKPAENVALLQLLHELSVENGTAIRRRAARDFLAETRGGKSGSLAKALLQLAEGDRTAQRTATRQRALLGRIERAERWARRKR